MKRLFSIITILCLAAVAMAQQKPVYDRSRLDQVQADRATWSRNFMAMPSGSTPGFPSYVPDSVKCMALFKATGANLSYPAGIYTYDCATSAWVPVGLGEAAADTLFIKNSNIPQAASFNILGSGSTSALFTHFVHISDGVGFTMLNSGNLAMNVIGGGLTLNPSVFSMGVGADGLVMGVDTFQHVTYLNSTRPLVMSGPSVRVTTTPVDSLDVVRLKDLQAAAGGSVKVGNGLNKYDGDTVKLGGVLTDAFTGLSMQNNAFYIDGYNDATDKLFNMSMSANEDAEYNYQVVAGAGSTGNLRNSFIALNTYTAKMGFVYNQAAKNITINQSNMIVVDSLSNKGLENKGDYEANFVPRSLATVQWVLSKVKGDSTISSGAYVKKSGSTMTGDLILASATPVNPLSAAPKSYIDNLITGITWKNAVRAKSTGNVTLSGIQTIDGVSGAANGRYLLNNQTTASQNGIWLMQSGAWTRPTDADESNEITMSTVAVTGGTVNKNTQWTYIGASDPVVGTDVISYGQISGAGTYSASNGLTLSGNVFTLDQSFTRGLFSASGSLSYNPSTGVFSAPTAVSAFSNDAAYINIAGARGAVSATGSISYNSATGVFSYTQPTALSAFTNDVNFQTVSGGNTAYLLASGETRAFATSGNITGSTLQNTSFNANFQSPNTTTIAPSSLSQHQYLSSSNVNYRIAFGGSSSGTVSSNANFAQVLFQSLGTITSNGTNAYGATGVFAPVTFAGTGWGNLATILITGAPTAGASNWSILSTSGTSNFVNAGDQMRLSYDATNYTTLATGPAGIFTITPTSLSTVINGRLIVGTNVFAATIANSVSPNNSQVALNNAGTNISRNVADANAALTVNQVNTSSTGNIQNFQFAGSSVAWIATNGRVNAEGMANTVTASNSLIQMTTTGTSVSRNVADANAVMRITNSNASSTGNIVNFLNSSGLRSFINVSGEFENSVAGNGTIYKSPDGTRYRISVANGGAIQTTAI